MKCYISYINVNIEAFLYIPVWICFSIPFKGRQAYPGEYRNPSSDPSIAKIVVVARWLLVCSSPAWLSICNHMFGIAVLRFLLLWLHPNEDADLSFQATFITDLVPANVISNNNYPGWSPPPCPDLCRALAIHFSHWKSDSPLPTPPMVCLPASHFEHWCFTAVVLDVAVSNARESPFQCIWLYTLLCKIVFVD